MIELNKFAKLETCSPKVKRSIGWLEKNLKDKSKIQPEDAIIIYVLDQVSSPIITNVNEKISKMIEEFDEDSVHDLVMSDPIYIYYLSKLGFHNHSGLHEWIDIMKKFQTVEGQIINEHSDALRLLNEIEPNSHSVKLGVKYLLEYGIIGYDIRKTAGNMIALIEIDSEKYWDEILEGKENIERNFKEEILKKDVFWNLHSIPNVLIAFGYMGILNSPVVRYGIEYILKYQLEDGSFGWNEKIEGKTTKRIAWPHHIAEFILGLLAVGEGPKVPVEFVKQKQVGQEKMMARSIPHFIHTSPLYKGSVHIREIYTTSIEMIRRAEKTIKISSPFIDMLYEELVSVAKEKPDIEIKIITRPARDIKGFRERIAKNVLDILNVASKGNLKKIDIIHSRIIIIDENEVLISSADLTRDSLFDEFNAGIWTQNKNTVKQAIEYFNNIWDFKMSYQK